MDTPNPIIMRIIKMYFKFTFNLPNLNHQIYVIL